MVLVPKNLLISRESRHGDVETQGGILHVEMKEECSTETSEWKRQCVGGCAVDKSVLE